MIQSTFTTLKERLTCFIAHDYTKWKHSNIHLGKQKVRHCKRGGCEDSEVVYQ